MKNCKISYFEVNIVRAVLPDWAISSELGYFKGKFAGQKLKWLLIADWAI